MPSDTASAVSEVTYRIRPAVTNDALNPLFAAAWPDHTPRDFAPVLNRSLVWVCAYTANESDKEHLIGFVNLAWDGGSHAFVLDTTVHSDFQRRGIGQKLVEHAAQVAKQHGICWLHVDYEPHLHPFYTQCGFTPTLAGLINLKRDPAEAAF